MTAGYPALRLRRTRRHGWSRALFAETVLTPSDLIWPLFVAEGKGVEETIASLPGVSRWSVDGIAARAREAASAGIPCIALFPNTPSHLRSDDGREALNPDNLMCRAVRAVKDAVPEIGVLTDVALDPYTSHGHDGLTDASGHVLNDETSAVLVEQALVQAAAGADIVAPSDMMDGRVGAIRTVLEREGHIDVQIMAYAAKYASAFYGPFRDAVGSRGRLKGDKRGYQMSYANTEEALREVALDLAEGADSVMVKPGLPYLDIVRRVKERFEVPVFAYQVSGEYAMIEAAVAAGAAERDPMVLETLTAFKRAGCSGVLSYHALHAARLLGGVTAIVATERLILREWRAEDRAPFAAMCRSAAVQRHLGEPQSDAEIEELIARIIERFARLGYGRWSIERRDDGRFLGLCGLVPFDRPGTPIHGDIEIGWQLDEAAWGQGYAQEAARASLGWGWANLDCTRIVAITVAANAASWRVMERIGMTRRPDLDFGHPLFAPEHRLHRHIAYVAERPAR